MYLPPMIDTNGRWPDIISRLEKEFEKIFKCSPRRRFDGKMIVYDDRKLDGDIEEGVWHVIARGEPRLFDPERARRLSWIGCMLDGVAPGLSRWRYIEGNGAVKIYLWLEAEKYVVIFAERRQVVALVTAFYVSQSWTQEDLKKRRKKGIAF